MSRLNTLITVARHGVEARVKFDGKTVASAIKQSNGLFEYSYFKHHVGEFEEVSNLTLNLVSAIIANKICYDNGITARNDFEVLTSIVAMSILEVFSA